MAICEMLVHKSTGDIVAAHPQGHKWHSGELADVFERVEVDLSAEALKELQKIKYKYSKNGGKIRGKGNAEFDSELLLEKTDAVAFSAVIRDVAAEIDPEWESKEPDVCKFLHPDWLPYPEDGDFTESRQYWFKKLKKLKKLPGMLAFLATVIYRDLGVISNAGRDLPAATQQAVFESDDFTEQDKTWLARSWRVSRTQLARDEHGNDSNK